MPRFHQLLTAALRALAPAALLTAMAVGCGPAGTTEQTSADDHEHGHDHGHEHEHDHGHRPESLHAAVARLTSIRDAVRVAIVEGDAGAAHEPLHEVAELLDVLPDVAADTDLPEAEWAEVKAANERLFDAFAAIDKAFHVKDGDKKAAYDRVAGNLDAALEAIRSRLPLTGEDPDGHEGHDDHGHDNHDHEHHGDHDHDHDDDHEGHEHHDHDDHSEAAE